MARLLAVDDLYGFLVMYVVRYKNNLMSSFLFFFCFADIYQPFKEDELEQSTEVQIMFPSDPPVSFLLACWC